MYNSLYKNYFNKYDKDLVGGNYFDSLKNLASSAGSAISSGYQTVRKNTIAGWTLNLGNICNCECSLKVPLAAKGIVATALTALRAKGKLDCNSDLFNQLKYSLGIANITEEDIETKSCSELINIIKDKVTFEQRPDGIYLILLGSDTEISERVPPKITAIMTVDDLNDAMKSFECNTNMLSQDGAKISEEY